MNKINNKNYLCIINGNKKKTAIIEFNNDERNI